MKKFYILFLIVLFSSCGSSNKIQFCEGVSKEGDGVNCGEKFDTGDLTALVLSDRPFDADSIDINIYRFEQSIETKIDTVTSAVNPRDTRVSVLLSFYKGGVYRIKAKKGDTVVSQGELEIVDH